MNRHAWLPLFVTCVIQTLATTISPYAGAWAAIGIGIYLAARLWFVDHPVTWRYDLAFWLALASVSVMAAGLRAGICTVLPVTGYTTQSCRSLSFEDAVWLHLATIGGVAAIFWLYGRYKIWRGSRHR